VIELDIGPNGHGSDVVQTMHAVVNPDKLAHLGPVSDVARLPEGRPSPGGPAADGGA
jgi:RNA polymerase sigma-70 factor (ECF subfamily)